MGIDSLDYVDIVVIIDRVFGFKIKPEDMTGVKTYGQFCDYIESKVKLSVILVIVLQWRSNGQVRHTGITGCIDG